MEPGEPVHRGWSIKGVEHTLRNNETVRSSRGSRVPRLTIFGAGSHFAAQAPIPGTVRNLLRAVYLCSTRSRAEREEFAVRAVPGGNYLRSVRTPHANRSELQGELFHRLGEYSPATTLAPIAGGRSGLVGGRLHSSSDRPRWLRPRR